MSAETSWRKPPVTPGITYLSLSIGIFLLVAVIGALKANFQNRIWIIVYITAVAIALAGGGILLWQRWSVGESVVCRRCGQALLLLGIIALLALSLFPQWFRSV
jgi:hypothetical protein